MALKDTEAAKDLIDGYVSPNLQRGIGLMAWGASLVYQDTRWVGFGFWCVGLAAILHSLWRENIAAGFKIALSIAGIVAVLVLVRKSIPSLLQHFTDDPVAKLKQEKARDEGACLSCAFACHSLRIGSGSRSMDDVCWEAGCCDGGLQDRIAEKAGLFNMNDPFDAAKKKLVVPVKRREVSIVESAPRRICQKKETSRPIG